MASRVWLDIELERVGEDVHVRSLGSRGECPEPHVLSPRGALEAFARRVEEAALAGESMDAVDGLGAEAEALYRGIFQGQLQEVLARLREAAGAEGAAGTARVWTLVASELRQRLRDVNRDCLHPDMRQTYLDEDEPAARKNYEDCERSHGRQP